MWHKRLLSADPEAGYREWYWSNPDTDEVAITTEWHLDPILDATKASFNQFDERANWKGDWHHVGVIPKYVMDYEWRTHGRKMLADKEYVRHWLNQPENRAFRSRPGRI
jgi:hypothetical protein